MRARFTTRSAAALALCASAPFAFAGDDFPPPWRGTPDSTWQIWRFQNPTNPFPDDWNNPYGVPQILPEPGNIWLPGPPELPSYTGGVICIPAGGSLSFAIPNDIEPTMQKEIYFQIKYFSPGTVPSPSGTDAAGNQAQPHGPTYTPSPGHVPGQSYWAGGLLFPSCTGGETITFTNLNPQQPMYIDQVVIDTRCIPTPASLALLGLAGLTVLRRRR